MSNAVRLLEARHGSDVEAPRRRDKRGGGQAPASLDELLKAAVTGAVPVEDLLTLEAALTRLESVDPRAAEIVVFRFFAGMSNPEVADTWGCRSEPSRATGHTRARGSSASFLVSRTHCLALSLAERLSNSTVSGRPVRIAQRVCLFDPSMRSILSSTALRPYRAGS